MKTSLNHLFIILASLWLNQTVYAQQAPGVYVIFDASGSMWGRLADDSYKIHTARTVLNQFVEGDFEGKELALRVYGHRREKDCSDSELLVPFGPAEEAVAAFQQAIKNINPKGRTPISYSLRRALEDFGDREGDIILISDGIETCNDDPCALMQEWREKNINIQVHVVGFGVEEKARLALQCIADAAGTPYHDAESSEELTESLSDIQQRPERTVLVIKGEDEQGNSWPIKGYLERNGTSIFQVKSNFHNDVEAGSYTLVAGIETRNGKLHQPVRQKITLPPKEETSVTLIVPLPARVSSRFMDGEEQVGGSLVSAYQNGEEQFRFRPKDEVFLDEGTYEFRATPNAENELSVTETFQAGDRKELLFQLVHTVRVYIYFKSEQGGDALGRMVELLQDGEVKYRMTSNNGKIVLPGTYVARSEDYFVDLPQKEIVINSEKKQKFEVLVPTGFVSFRYLKADGSQDKDDRVFVGPAGSRKRIYQRGGTRYAYPSGNYVVEGWKHKGNYEPVTFSVVAGQEKVINLRAR
ncbi:MAG: hypothetical protein AAF587_21195 [Bacteroidota bacterium]